MASPAGTAADALDRELSPATAARQDRADPPEVHHQDPPGQAAPAPPQMQAIVLSGATARFPGRSEPSVDRLSLVIPYGQIFGLLGPNGSGKTTTVNMVIGLLTPGSGEVRVFGHDPRSQSARRLIGVVTQETALYPKLDAVYNLRFYARLYGYTGAERRARVTAALELANLVRFARQPVGGFSGGMARRLAIARALLPSPRLLILDEPTLGVDTVERAELWRHILRLRDAGITVLLTTNVLEEAEALCDRVAIMREGRLVTGEPASPEYLREHYGAMVITVRAQAGRAEREEGLAALRTIREITRLQVTLTDERAGTFEIQATASVQGEVTGKIVMLLGRNVVILDVDKRMPTLEEVFRHLTTGPLKAPR
jgi:ABC-2 type transport system ATP-binding protein